MALNFNGLDIPGTHEDIRVDPWTFPLQKNTLFGLVGTTVLVGYVTERRLAVPMWIWNGYSQGALNSAMYTLESYTGTVGTLTELGNVSRTFPSCLFYGFATEFGPHPSPQLGWFVSGTLVFEQLRPE